MKKIITTALLTLMVLISLSSCSKEDTSNLILPKKIIYTDETSENYKEIQTSTFIYNGNKIIKIERINYSFPHRNSNENYVYKGNLIVKQYSDDSETHFSYEKNKLKKINGLEYIYNLDNTILVHYPTVGDYLLTFENENLIKNAFVIDTYYNDIKGIYSNISTYENDIFNNPFKNVLGFNKLIDITLYDILTYVPVSQTNNVTKRTKIITNTAYSKDNSKYVTTYDYTYNSDGYPTFCKVTSFYEGDYQISQKGTIQYFYE
jgi:hypothetical protein